MFKCKMCSATTKSSSRYHDSCCEACLSIPIEKTNKIILPRDLRVGINSAQNIEKCTVCKTSTDIKYYCPAHYICRNCLLHENVAKTINSCENCLEF